MSQGFREPVERIVTLVARDVEPLLDDLVLVGGVATALLITDRAAARAPATDDVDVVVDVATRSEYERLSERLRELGLRHDTSEYVLQGNLPDARTVPGLVESVRRRLERIAAIGG